MRRTFLKVILIIYFAASILMACTETYHSQSLDDRTDNLSKIDRTQPIHAYPYLRKLSFHLRGYSPTPDEYAQLAQQLSLPHSNVEMFFEHKITEYLESDDFVDKMEYRLEELFSLMASPTTVSHTRDYNELAKTAEPAVISSNIYNSLNELFRRIVRDNLSWDQLLLDRSFVTFPTQNLLTHQPDAFFYKLFKTIDSTQATRVDFPSDNPQIAGALSGIL